MSMLPHRYLCAPHCRRLLGAVLLLFLPLSAFAEGAGAPLPSPTPTPTATPAATPETTTPPEAEAAPKARPYPFRSVVFTIDKDNLCFQAGKRKVRQIHLAETTRIRFDDGTPATFADLSEGLDIRGSLRKRADGHEEAVSLILGAKGTTAPQ